MLEISHKRIKAQQIYKLNSDQKTLLVLGGSLGARAINQLIEREINWLVDKKVQVVWQTGKVYFDEYKHFEKLKGVQTFEFINTMDLAYAAADIIISRAGASSISELCIVGKPVIFIPSPNVAEDHQTKNAMAIQTKNAAILKENELNNFKKQFESLLQSQEKQDELVKILNNWHYQMPQRISQMKLKSYEYELRIIKLK